MLFRLVFLLSCLFLPCYAHAQTDDATEKLFIVSRFDTLGLCDRDSLVFYSWDICNYKPRIREMRVAERLAYIVNCYPGQKFVIKVFTCCLGDSLENLNQTREEADRWVKLVQSMLNDPTQVRGIGYGENQLLNDCACDEGQRKKHCTLEEHAQNKRVVFRMDTGQVKR